MPGCVTPCRGRSGPDLRGITPSREYIAVGSRSRVTGIGILRLGQMDT